MLPAPSSVTGFKPAGAMTLPIVVVSCHVLIGHPVFYADVKVGKMNPTEFEPCVTYWVSVRPFGNADAEIT